MSLKPFLHHYNFPIYKSDYCIWLRIAGLFCQSHAMQMIRDSDVWIT